jgi:hypothetical protein
MIKAREREDQALDLRITGATYRQIGDALGIDHSTAEKAVERALARKEASIADKAGALRALEHERLERMIMAAMPNALKGDIASIEAVRKLSESIRRMLDLDLAGIKHTFAHTIEIVGLQLILDKVYGKPRSAWRPRADHRSGDGSARSRHAPRPGRAIPAQRIDPPASDDALPRSCPSSRS